MNDKEFGRRVRAVRQHLGLRQLDVARLGGVSRFAVLRIEAGDLAKQQVQTVRAVLRALDMEVEFNPWWRGGELDRLLDEGHATVEGIVIRRLEAHGWIVQPEVSFSIYGEHGSIDLLAWHPATRTLLVIEVKASLNSLEETMRRLDVKVRLAPQIARERFGWQAATTAFLLALPEDPTARRRVERHASLMDRAFPMRGARARAWLRSPSGRAGMLLFLSDVHQPNLRRRGITRKRIRPRQTARSSSKRAPTRTSEGNQGGGSS